MTKFELTDTVMDAAMVAYETHWDHGPALKNAITAAFEASGILEENARLRAYFTETGRILRSAIVKEDAPSIFIIDGKEHKGRFMDTVYPFLMDMQEQCQQALNKGPTP